MVSLLVIAGLASCGTDTATSTPSADPVVSVSAGEPDPEVTITTTDPVDENTQSSFSLRLTDAPLDGVTKVVIQFSGVQILGDNEIKSTTFTFVTPQTIDLLQLQGAKTAVLLNEVPIEVGTYSEIRLFTSSDNSASYVETSDGGIHELKIPSGSSSGLKLKGEVTVTTQRDSAYIIDFDLLKSVVKAGNSGKYNLKPVLRLISDSTVGHISGMVKSALLINDSCSDSNVDTFNRVYVFEGHNQTPNDINQSDSDQITPITTSAVKYNIKNDQYAFEAAFLPAGDYTIAITCNANLENLDSDDELLFFGIQNVTVLKNNTIFL